MQIKTTSTPLKPQPKPTTLYPRLMRALANPEVIALQTDYSRAICVSSSDPVNPVGAEWTADRRGRFNPENWEPFYGSVTITSEP